MKLKMVPAAIAGILLFSAGCENSSIADTGKPANVPALPGGEIATPTTRPSDPVLVTVNGQDITASMFNLYLSSRAQTMNADINDPRVKNQAINELINVVVLYQDGERNGVEKIADVQTAIELKRMEIISRAALSQVAQNTKVSQEDLQAAYEKRFGNAQGSEYKASHILVATEAEAQDLIGKLEAGEDFAELAKTFSTGPTGKNGGDLGWFASGQMVKPFSDAVAAMQKGEYSKAPVQTKFGWHVILLTDIRDKQPPSFESVRASLESDIQRKALTDKINNLRDQSEVVVNQALAKQAPEAKTE